MTEHERIWLEPAGVPDRCWCQDNQWGDEGVEYVLASTLESLQRENEEKSAWIKSATTEITKAIGGGSEMFTPHGDEFRVDPAFVASFIQYRRERHTESKKASIQKERELLARAEAAEAKVKRLQAEIDRKSSMPGDHRYWEGRYRDEAAENDRLRGILFKCGSFIADRYQEGDAEYQVVLLVNDAICSKPALASTGGEHNGN